MVGKALTIGILVFLGSAALALAGDAAPRQAALGALKASLAARAAADAAAANPGTLGTATSCVTTIACGQTVQGALAAECQVDGDTAIDLFQFAGTAGEVVTITAASSDFAPFFDLEEPVTDASAGTGEGTTSSPAVLRTILDATGTWSIGATNFGDAFEAGNYTLSLACSVTPPNPLCTPDANTLCLDSGRFKVTAAYNAGSSGSGQANVVALTDDTGYLWFFDVSNVEAVVKVLDGCAISDYYWVFAGGLTNVRVAMTVTDTYTGIAKTYRNPQNTVFQPIQDTGAFAACP
jgi:hypothetical protein